MTCNFGGSLIGTLIK